MYKTELSIHHVSRKDFERLRPMMEFKEVVLEKDGKFWYERGRLEGGNFEIDFFTNEATT